MENAYVSVAFASCLVLGTKLMSYPNIKIQIRMKCQVPVPVATLDL